MSEASAVKQAEADIDLSWRAVYRTNTYPFIHLNFFHMIINVIAVTPFLERFESEFGTLTSLALFFGRESHPSPQ